MLERGQFGDRLLEFAPVEDFFGVLDRIGHMPLPPYIHRDDAACRSRALPDGIFARARIGRRADGRPALHAARCWTASPRGESRLRASRCTWAWAPLRRLRVERVDEVRLHRERYSISAETADAVNRARSEGRRIVAVGTTVVRTLEAARRCAPDPRP